MNKVCFFVPSLNIGGIENVFITYANELAARGYDVSFILCHKEGELLTLVSNTVKVDDLGNCSLRNAFLPLRRYIKYNLPDYLITGGDFPNLVCVLVTRTLRNKPKVIISKHNYRNTETKELGWWSFLDLNLQRIFYPKADKIIAVSFGIKNYLTGKLSVNPAKVTVLHNPIDLEKIIENSEKNISIAVPEKYIVFVGRVSKVKNLYYLIKSFDIIDDDELHLIIVGDGTEKILLEEYAGKNKSRCRIHFVGSYGNPMPFIKRSQVLVLCSLSEAYPTILLEAMTLNIPIVATPTEGAKEILDGIDGVYITESFSNEYELAELIKKALNSNRKDLMQYAKNNDKNNVVDQFENILKAII